MFELLIWWVLLRVCIFVCSWHVYEQLLNVIFLIYNRKASFGKHYVVGYIFAKPCVGMRMGKMAVLWHASFMPDYLTSVSSWNKSHFHSFLHVLSHVFRKEYGLVSCKSFSWYTPNREAGMRVPWPWIKACHSVRGHGCFRLGPRGGPPLRARV